MGVFACLTAVGGVACLCIQESVVTSDDAGWKGRSAQLGSAGFGVGLAGFGGAIMLPDQNPSLCGRSALCAN